MFKYRFFSMILVIFTLIGLIGCKDNTDDAFIYFELPEVPLTLDPQTADTDSELLIVRNIYEGLMRKDEDGKVNNGACEEYSKEGLTYTFKLRPDMLWNNGERVTANDFVYGLKRALDPETKAPFASRLFAIKNAKAVNSGELSKSNLGVSAPNENTVVISLEYEDANFLENLTTSVAMPCNQEFFTESKGKYGLFSENLICNGSYRLTKWNKESFGIRLYKNEEYNGLYKAKNAAVFLTCNKDTAVTEKLKENKIDIAFVDCALKNDMEESGLKTRSFQNICWVMTLNNDLSKEMRKSLLMLIGDKVFGESLSSGYTAAYSIYPEISNTECDGIGFTYYDLAKGKSIFTAEVKKLTDAKFPSNITLYYYNNGFTKPIITDIVGHWQSNLSAFVNIEAAENKENLLPELKAQTLTMAIFPVRVESKNHKEYLANYGVTGDNLADAQNKILESKNILPLFFQDTTLCYSADILEINLTEDNGFIDFAFVVKMDS